MQVAAVNLLASGGDALVQAFSSSRKRRTVFKGLGDLTFDASRLLRLNPPDSVIVGASTRQRAHQSDAANANIQQAVSRTQSLELHLSEVYDTVSNLEELRGQASQTNLTDAQRTEINTNTRPSSSRSRLGPTLLSSTMLPSSKAAR